MAVEVGARWPSVAFLQELGELVDAALVAPAGEFGAEEGLDAGLGHVAADQPGAEGQDVGVIMLAGQRGRQRLVDPGAAAGGLRLTAIEMPMPEPQTTMPALGLAAGDRVARAWRQTRDNRRFPGRWCRGR